jgi:DNA-binding response OmpR family regulator
MLTAMSQASDRDRAIEAGADGYIVKPFSPRALLAELDQRLP